MANKENLGRRISKYLRDVKLELKKVTWPSRQEIISSTIVVIVTVIFFALLVGGLDFIFAKLIKFVSFKL